MSSESQVGSRFVHVPLTHFLLYLITTYEILLYQIINFKCPLSLFSCHLRTTKILQLATNPLTANAWPPIKPSIYEVIMLHSSLPPPPPPVSRLREIFSEWKLLMFRLLLFVIFPCQDLKAPKATFLLTLNLCTLNSLLFIHSFFNFPD